MIHVWWRLGVSLQREMGRETVGGKAAKSEGERGKDRVNSVQPLTYCPSPESAVDESRPADREMNESQCKYTS